MPCLNSGVKMAPGKYIYCPHCGRELEEAIIEQRLRERCPECERVFYVNPLPVVSCLLVNSGGNEAFPGKLKSPPILLSRNVIAWANITEQVYNFPCLRKFIFTFSLHSPEAIAKDFFKIFFRSLVTFLFSLK